MKFLKENIKDNINVVFLFDDLMGVNIFWLLRFIKKNNYKLILPYRVSPLDKTKSLNTKIKLIYTNFKYVKYILPRLYIKFLKFIYINSDYYKKPDLMFIPGNNHNYWRNQLSPKKIISINSPQLLIKKFKKRQRHLIFIDEFPTFNRDAKLFNFNSTLIDSEKYFNELNYFFKIVETYYGFKIKICCSNKHHYNENPYNNREIIYGKTLENIGISSLVIGHDSDSLFQSIYSKSPTILLISDSQINIKKQKIKNFSNLIGVNYINLINKKELFDFHLKIKRPDNKNLLSEFFLNVDGSNKSHVNTVIENL